MPLTFDSQDKNGLVTTSKKGLASFFKLSVVVKKDHCFLFDRIILKCFFHLWQEMTEDIFLNFISSLNKKCGTHCDIAPTFHQINLIN